MSDLSNLSRLSIPVQLVIFEKGPQLELRQGLALDRDAAEDDASQGLALVRLRRLPQGRQVIEPGLGLRRIHLLLRRQRGDVRAQSRDALLERVPGDDSHLEELYLRLMWAMSLLR